MRANGCNQCWYSPFNGGPHQNVWMNYKCQHSTGALKLIKSWFKHKAMFKWKLTCFFLLICSHWIYKVRCCCCYAQNEMLPLVLNTLPTYISQSATRALVTWDFQVACEQRSSSFTLVPLEVGILYLTYLIIYLIASSNQQWHGIHLAANLHYILDGFYYYFVIVIKNIGRMFLSSPCITFRFAISS